MLADMVAEDIAGIDRHRTVEKNRYIGNPLRLLEPIDVVEDRLHATDGERRNKHHSAPLGCPIDDVGEVILGIGRFVCPVAIGRLDYEEARAVDDRGIDSNRMLRAAKIAGKHQFSPRTRKLDNGRAEDMSGGPESDVYAATDLEFLFEVFGNKQLEAADRVGFGIQGQRGLVLRETMSIGVLGVALLKVPAVR